MKGRVIFLITIGVLLLISIVGKAQINLLKHEKSYVINIMKLDTSFLVENEVVDKELTVVWCNKKHPTEDNYRHLVLFFKSDTLVMYEVVDFKSKLSRYIITLNQKYTKQNEDTWIDISNSIAYVLKVFDDGYLGMYVKPL